MDKSILIYLSNTIDSFSKLCQHIKFLKILIFFFFEITVTRIEKNKLLGKISVHKSNQLKLWSDFIKNIWKGVNF